MNFKLKSILFVFAIATMVGFSSCEDEITAPVISNSEIGEDNSKTATIGGELHLDAEIDAPGKIDKITVDLHPEGFTADDIELEYTSYSGQLNADFHEDFPIPSTAVAGEYHFHLKVIDQEGNTTGIEADVNIQ